MKKYLMLAGILLFSGCAQYTELPIDNELNNNQYKIESLYQWKIVTNNIVKHINPNFKSQPIYLTLPSNSKFELTFNNFLKNSLIKQGYNIVTDKKYASLLISYKINIVKNQISLTLTIKNKKQYLDSINRIYYISEDDIELYKLNNFKFNIKG